MDNNPQFDAAYWLAQPPELRGLPAIVDFDQRVTAATALATKGYTVDVPIMVWGWDPWKIMSYRASYGFVWVESALQPPPSIAPGVSEPGMTPYSPIAPPGSIRVSVNIADYPPFDPPAPAVPVPVVADPVGVQSLGTLYISLDIFQYPDGAKFSDARGTFLKHIVMTPFGRSPYWELVTPAVAAL